MVNGIYTDISITDYHANKTHISSTQIKTAKQSLKHFKWTIDEKIAREDKTQFHFGNAVELALLSETEYLKSVAVADDAGWCEEAKKSNPDLVKLRASAVYKKLELDFLNANKGKYIIQDTGNESFETIECMLESCRQDKAISSLIENTEYQLSLFWTDEETGLGLKTRPDICKRKKNVMINVKTIENGSPDKFSKDLKEYDYPLQACIEITGALKTGLMPAVDAYYWLVLEKKPPYNATIYEFADQDISACMDGMHYTLNRIAKAKKEDKWPGYGGEADNQFGILTAKIPSWYKF
jgi:hypothetical protein